MQSSGQRILFLYLNTGGGHLGPAKALMAQIRETYGSDAPALVLKDGMPETSSLVRRLVEQGYWFTSTVFPVLWGLIYHGSRLPWVTGLELRYARHHAAEHLAKLIQDEGITKVVNLHFLLAPPLEKALQRLEKNNLPRVTVVSDPFSVHPAWSFGNPSPLVALSEEAGQILRRRLKRQNLDPGRVLVAGPVVEPKFSRPLAATELESFRSEWGLDPALPVVLLAGGAGGLPGAERFLRAIVASDLQVQVVLVCGRNHHQHTRATRWLHRHPAARVRVFGFVPFMDKLLNLADVILTKAGAGTVFEILSLRKPMIITSYLYGQERGNVDYVVKNGYGWYLPRVGPALARLRHLLEHPEETAALARKIAAREPANGAEQIARHIVEGLG